MELAGRPRPGGLPGRAAAVAELIAEPAVAAAWDRPSALPDFGVGGLAAHTAHQ